MEFYFKLKNYKLLSKIFLRLQKFEVSKNYLIKMIQCCWFCCIEKDEIAAYDLMS